MQIIAIGFFVIITIGTLLLMLPAASKGAPATPLTALFTATSATCVTGLVVADTFQQWTFLGQLIILTMIQVGGLGFMTIGVFFSIYIRRKISLRERGLLQESINTLQIAGVVKLTKKIMAGTLLFEGIGAVLLSLRFIPRFGFWKGCYYGVFHSVSAFCNAGFDLMGEEQAYISLSYYVDDAVVNLVIMLLIIIGGIGFIVWDDISRNGLRFRKYLLHTKIVLLTTTVLIFGGAVLFWLMEREGVLVGMGTKTRILASLFGSVTARTAGFNTVDTGAMSEGSMLLTMIFMFIGGSPGSTAGGVKTTTLVVMLLYIWTTLRNGNGCNIFGRRLDEEIVKKASVVFGINLILSMCIGTAICGLQPELPMDGVLFEVFSAIGTVGMSTGLTRSLSSLSRILIILLMYCGRIGSMTFALSFAQNKERVPVQNPVEKIAVG